MSKTYYPVINYDLCIECGACVNKCTHDVYEKGTNSPNVVLVDGCVDGCTGCQKLCPVGAIDYVGADKGKSACGCGGSCS